MDIQYAVHKFGAYFFKPVTAKSLQVVGVPDDVIKELGVNVESNDPLYLMGVVANEWTPVRKNGGADMLKALDDFVHPTGYDFVGPISLLWLLGDRYASNGRSIVVKRNTINLLETLITFVGVAEHFVHTPPGHVPLQMLEIRARLDALQHSVVWTPENVSPAVEPPPEKETPVAPQEPQEQPAVSVPNLTRKEILELLKNERECVIRAETCDRDCSKCPLVRDSGKLIAMYDAVIKCYTSVMKQNRKGKYVHMADGTRKWFSNEKAAEMLALPIGERK